MHTFTVVFLCIQAYLVPVFGQCTSCATVAAEPGLIAPGLAPYGLGAPFAYDGLAGMGAPLGYRAGLGEIAYPAAGRGLYGDIAYPAAGIPAPYGGIGEGNVAVAGELPVAGSTTVAGQVPIMGAVNFGGDVPAAGVVCIAGQCTCGYGAAYGYL